MPDSVNATALPEENETKEDSVADLYSRWEVALAKSQIALYSDKDDGQYDANDDEMSAIEQRMVFTPSTSGLEISYKLKVVRDKLEQLINSSGRCLEEISTMLVLSAQRDLNDLDIGPRRVENPKDSVDCFKAIMMACSKWATVKEAEIKGA